MTIKMMQPRLVNAAVTALLMFCPAVFAGSLSAANARSGVPQSRPIVNEYKLKSTSDSAIITVTAPAVNRLVGSSFAVPVTVTDTTGEGIISWQFDLLFNPAIITPQAVPVSTSGTLGNGLVVTYNSPTPGLLKVVLFGTIPIAGSGTLFNFQFTAVGLPGETSPLTWQNFMFNEGTPGSVATNGSITLIAPTAAGASVEGRIVDITGRSVRNAEVVLASEGEFQLIARTNAFGYFSFANVPTGATYLLSARTKILSVRPTVVGVFDDVTGLELVAEPDLF